MYAVLVVIVIVVVAAFFWSQREGLTAAAATESVRDLVDNGLDFATYRAKYGDSVDSLQLNFLISEYKAGTLTPARAAEILKI